MSDAVATTSETAQRLSTNTPLLVWKQNGLDNYDESQLGTPDDGVLFTLSYWPTCYRRGPWRLLVTVCGGENHRLWGCFDEADQPERNYHFRECALK